ncbi:MAG: WD40 repeat domain-containing serine/threonine protein kinase [Planctomycetota bacterium]
MPDQPDPQRVQKLFEQAMDLPPDERPSFILDAVGDDEALGEEVAALVEAAEAADGEGFLQVPADRLMAKPPTEFDGFGKTEKKGQLIGRYKLLQRLGEGGMGSVWMAEQTSPVVRRVALKVIKLGMDTMAVVARFEAERQALALMDHPHIARVLDAGVTDTGRPYFVMDLVRGDPITAYADKHSLDIPARLDLFRQVCSAVQHAHQKGVIHRDLKPANVLVATEDGRPFAKVIDFGIAKAISQRLTEKTLFTAHGGMIGTLEYMSPEQADGSLDVDTRSDVYSLGVILYELLTGTTPLDHTRFAKGAIDEWQRIIREEEPPKPSTRVSTSLVTSPEIAKHRRSEPKRLGLLMRGELDWMVMKALEKDRSRRYDSAGNFADDVERHAAGDPVEAAPPSHIYQLRKLVRRHRGPVVAAASVLIALLLGLLSTSVFATHAIREGQRADEEAEVAVLRRNESIAAARAANEARNEAVERLNENKRLSYANTLSFVSASLDDFRPGDAFEWLEKTPEDVRGWEWGVLRNKAAALQADRWWTPAIEEFSTELLGVVVGIDIDTSEDGTVLAAIDDTGRLRVWDISRSPWNLKPDLETTAGEGSATTPIAMTADGSLVAVGGADGHVRLFNVVQPTSEPRHFVVSQSHVAEVRFRPNRSQIAALSVDGKLKIWDFSDHSLFFERSIKDVDRLQLAFSQGGRHVHVMFNIDNQSTGAQSWTVDSGRHIENAELSLLLDNFVIPTDLRRFRPYSKGGRRSLGTPRSPRLSIEPLQSDSIRDQEGLPCYGDERRSFLSRSEIDDDRQRSNPALWLVSRRRATEQSAYRSFTKPYTATAIDIDTDTHRELVYMVGDSGDIHIYDYDRAEHLVSIIGDGSRVTDLSLSPDGSRLAIVRRDSISLIDTWSLEYVWLIDQGDHQMKSDRICWHPSGDYLIAATFLSEDVTVSSALYVIDTRRGEIQTCVEVEYDGFIDLMFSHDGHTLIGTSFPYDEISRWDTNSWTRIESVIAETKAMFVAEVNPYSGDIAYQMFDTVPSTGEVDLRGPSIAVLRAGEEITDAAAGVSHPTNVVRINTQLVSGFAFHPDGERLAVGTVEGGVSIVGSESGRAPRYLGALSRRDVRDDVYLGWMAFDRSGRRLITVSICENETIVGVWDSADPTRQLDEQQAVRAAKMSAEEMIGTLWEETRGDASDVARMIRTNAEIDDRLRGEASKMLLRYIEGERRSRARRAAS